MLSGIATAPARTLPRTHRVVYRVVQQERDALLVLHAEFAQGIGKTDAAYLQVAIGERTLRVDECDLVAKAARDIGVDEIGDGVVRAAQFVQHAAPVPSAFEQSCEEAARQHAGDAAAVVAGREGRLHRHDLVAHERRRGP